MQAAKADEHPLSLDVQRQLREQAERAVAETTQRLEQSPDDIDALSRRGDAYFQLAKFPEAAADFDRMVQHRPELDAEHWRRGIAWFYAEEFQQAAAQFERYHTFDQVDRENGVWRWLSQRRAHGADAARAGLLKYEKDDRPPLNDVYRLFAGTMTGDELTAKLDAAELSQSDRDVQEFYAHLYIGLHHAVEDRPSEALPQLRAATANRWAPTASYGPRWMWHVGRVHYERLRAAAESTPQSE